MPDADAIYEEAELTVRESQKGMGGIAASTVDFVLANATLEQIKNIVKGRAFGETDHG
jgi:hypothetical protein